jgi:ribose transport system permease protein
VGGTAIGVLFIGILQNGLSIAGVQSFWQQVITGLILLLAVMIDQVGSPRPGWLRLPGRRTAAPAEA